MQNTPTKTTELTDLKTVVVDLVALVNQSPLAGRMAVEAKVSIDPALLRVAAVVHRFGPMGVVELAERAGRDHTTVSRQVAKLEQLDLVERRPSALDKRMSEIVLTTKGRRTGAMLMAAQDKVLTPVLAKWSDRDLGELTRLMRRLVDDLTALRDQPT